MSGSRAGPNSLSGKGELRLRDADIYELPLVLALLKMLRVKAPDRNAFGSSFVDFRVEGPRFYLDTIELSGDAISLVGNGELDFDGNTHMTFRSIMGDSQQQLPVMKRMLGGASGQFMLIHVDGTLADPKMTSEAFPTLNAAIQKLQIAVGEFRAVQEFSRAKLELERARALRDTYLAIKDSARRLAERDGYDYILLDDSLPEMDLKNATQTMQQISARRFIFATPKADATTALVALMNDEWKAAKSG
jgi:CheY-like chemotaxis protein